MFKPMAQTVAFALLGAFLLSLTYIPMMSALILRKNKATNKNWADQMMVKMEGIYQASFQRVFQYSKAIILATTVLFCIAIFVLSQMGGEFIPSLPEGDFAVETRVLTGSSLQTSIDAISAGSKLLLAKFPEVIKVVGKTGSSEVPTDPMPIEASDMMVILKDKDQWTSAKTYDELTEKMSKVLEAVPGVTYGFQYPVQMRFNELMTGARQDVVCKIFGDDLDSLAFYAKKLGDITSTVKGARDLYVESVTGMPQIVVKYNRTAIAQFGLNVSDINRVVNTAFAGQSSGLVFEGERRFDLIVRLGGALRKNVDDVQNLLIPCPNGMQIPLNQVATVEVQEGPNQIQREDAQRRIVVGFNIRGRDVQSMVSELQDKAAKQMKLPAGYYITYGGAFENLEAATKRLGIAVPVSLLLVFLLLYFAFGSLRHGLLIFSAIPLSAIGGILALAVRDMPFSISAGIGFIALFGVSVLNGIVLVSEFNRLRQSGWDDLEKIVLQGTKYRLRPVLMTGTVASLGFLPMAFSHGEGAEVQRPLATVVIGGLIIATFLTLYVLPILYVWFEKKNWKKKSVIPTITTVFLICCANIVFAQHTENQSITLQKAIDMGVANSLFLQTEQLKVVEKTAQEKTVEGLPKTQFGLEVGQFNSRVLDTKWSATQTLRSAKVRKAETAVLKSQTDIQRHEVVAATLVLKAEIRNTWYKLAYLKAKKDMLLRYDSLFSENLRVAYINIKTGESGLLEKKTAEIQQQQWQQQLRQLEAEINAHQIDLQFLLQTDQWYMPENQSAVIPFTLQTDTASLKMHPQLGLLAQQIIADQRQTAAMRMQLLPEFSVGYALQSIRGTQTFGNTEYSYNSAPQFSVIQLGVQVPLSKKSINSRIEVAKVQEQVTASTLKAKATELQYTYQRLAQDYQTATQNLAYFEEIALPQVQSIIHIADVSRRNGEIGYAEWALSIRQYIEVQNNYFEAIRVHNIIVLQLLELFDH